MKFLFYQENFYGEFERYLRERLWKRATFLIGAPVWELGGGSFTENF